MLQISHDEEKRNHYDHHDQQLCPCSELTFSKATFDVALLCATENGAKPKSTQVRQTGPVGFQALNHLASQTRRAARSTRCSKATGAYGGRARPNFWHAAGHTVSNRQSGANQSLRSSRVATQQDRSRRCRFDRALWLAPAACGLDRRQRPNSASLQAPDAPSRRPD